MNKNAPDIAIRPDRMRYLPLIGIQSTCLTILLFASRSRVHVLDKQEKGADLFYIQDSPEYERSQWQSTYRWRDTIVVLPNQAKNK